MLWGLEAEYILYGVCLGLSLLIALLSVFSGSDFDLDGGVDLEGPEHGPAIGSAGLPRYSLLNPLALLGFLGGFGATGLIVRGAGGALALSLGAAVIAGLGLSLAFFRFFVRFILGSQGGAVHATEHSVGKLARVTVAIPAAGLGAVSYEADGRRQTISARCQGEQVLGRGCEVVIVSLEHHIALVRPFNHQTVL